MPAAWRFAFAAPALLILVACPTVRTPQLHEAANVPRPSPHPLKVHLRSGELLVLSRWTDMPGDSALWGTGRRYDARRRSSVAFAGVMPRDSIALLETASHRTVAPAGSVILGTYTVLAGAVTIACLADPKGCFGSCPTFYLEDADDRPVAEGFSGSVARALEATDIDDLGLVRGGGTFAVTMRNEALETHVVRSVRLVAVRTPHAAIAVAGEAGGFGAVAQLTPPEGCRSGTADCGAMVAARDGAEWSTRADPEDLGRLDSLELSFPAAPARAVLLATARQSFVSTWVFYQALAWAGSRAGELLAAVERHGTDALPGAWAAMRRLATIEVFARRPGGTWVFAGSFGEPGPIAPDRHALPLPPDAGPLEVRLRFTRGAWRFDELVVASLGGELDAVVIEPFAVERAGRPDTLALQRLRDPSRYLVTNPADRYRLTYALPAGAWSLFLESTGHYYEWMRPEWLREENAALLALLAARPEEALRRMAPDYARREPALDSLFWASRFGRN